MKTFFATARLERAAARERRGGALVSILVCTGILAMLSLSLIAVGLAESKEERTVREVVDAQYVADAAMSVSVANLRAGGNGTVGSTNNQVAYGKANFWVDSAQPAANLRTLTATGVEDRAGARVELTLRQDLQSMWLWGAFGDQVLSMDSNARVDSYRSGSGTYASQAVNGSGSTMYAHTLGDVGSNGNVTVEQNAKVWGDAVSGPSSTTTVMGNAVVTGTTTPAQDPTSFPAITLPGIAHVVPKVISATTTLAAGDIGYSTLTINANKTLNITGPARIVVGSFQIKSGGKLIVNATNGPVKIWVIDDFLVNSNTLIASTTYKPADIEINLLSDNIISPEVVVDLDEIDFDSNAKMYGTLYAPNAQIEIDSNFELFGSMVARAIDLDSNCRIHFDESLATDRGDGTPIWVRVACRPLPYTP